MIVGITGGSGSGKTSFIRKLREGFTEDQLCIISQDDYYKPRRLQQLDENGVHNFDIPYAIDNDAFQYDIQALKAGKSITREEYTFNNELATPKLITLKPAKIILVEGIFIFHFEEIRKLLDLKVFLHAKENLKVIRRIKRDQIERNYPLEDVLYRYEHHVMPTYEQYILPYRDECDIVINNNGHFANSLEVLIGYFKNMIK